MESIFPLILLLSLLILLLLLNVPIFASLGLAALVTLITTAGIPLNIVSQKFYSNIATFPLMAVPFFLLTSGIMERSNVSKRIVDLADAFVGSIKGGLALTGLFACAIFSTISGSSLATMVGVGSVVMPRMIEQGYDRRFAVGSIVAGGTLGILIPPSIPLIIYGFVTGTSVVALFAAAILPGIILAAALMVTTYVFASRGVNAGPPRNLTWSDRKVKLRAGVWTLLIPLGIFLGIYGIPGLTSAIFTPTEASIVAVFLALFVAAVIYRDFRLRDMPNVLAQASSHIGVILLIVASAMLFAFVVNEARVPQTVAAYLVDIDLTPALFLLLVNIILFFAGDFIDALPIILIFVPVLFPAATALGIDPVHFGIMVVVNLEMGAITPPVGLNLFAASSILKMDLYEVLRASAPWILVVVAVLILVTYVPAVSLWLPELMVGYEVGGGQTGLP